MWYDATPFIRTKSSSDESDVHENFPKCRISDVAVRLSFDQSARKIPLSYDCQSIPFYESQEGIFRNLAEREDFWDHLTRQKQPKPHIDDRNQRNYTAKTKTGGNKTSTNKKIA